jgi:hypothetical protein
MAAIVGVFQNGIDLERALFELDSYLAREHIFVIDREHEFSLAPGTRRWQGIDTQPETINEQLFEQDMQTLEGLGITSRSAAVYAEAVQQGLKLLVVQAGGKEIFHVYEILSSYDSGLISESR